MAQTLTSLLVHIVFSTRYRQPLIHPEIESSLFAYMGGILRNNNSRLITAGGTADHVHLLVSQSKTLALSELVMDVKKDSSSWLKTQERAFRVGLITPRLPWALPTAIDSVPYGDHRAGRFRINDLPATALRSCASAVQLTDKAREQRGDDGQEY